jgi:membrane complex biogenesis BtpA family protein
MIGPLIGMVHLGPLPGSPRHGGDFDAVIASACEDGRRLAEAGFDALLVENFGDHPFFADDVPKVTVAAMTAAVGKVAGAVDLPIGVNVLRNDAEAALSVAAATGATFIRVNVLSGLMHTDQGTITGRAALVARLKAMVAPDVVVLADVFVKHAVPPMGLTVEQAATDLWERAGADGIVMSGPRTGRPLDAEQLDAVRAAVPEAPLYAGSGVDRHSVAALLRVCAGVIVGTSVKEGGVTGAPVDPVRAKELVVAAR